ncbi:MAG: hypothetical protein HY812_00540 [Planctomycetes bacterium]|nr:hypothetical protein [Planctomycetota bacterium]
MLAATLLCLLASPFAAQDAASEGVPGQPELLFREDFAGAELAAPWAAHASAGNRIAVRDGHLEITARENTFAHVVRPLGQDLVRASCRIQGGTGISWAASLFLYWSPGNWCQMGVIRRTEEALFYCCEMNGGQPVEHDLACCAAGEWQHVAIELGEDCVRFLSSADGSTWSLRRLAERAVPFHGPPALLILGKGYGRGSGERDLDTDYGDPGPASVSLIADVLVRRTAPQNLQASALDREEIERLGRDELGEQELAAAGDPTFESVSRYFPPMQHPREALGVKDHAHEFLVAPDAAIEIAGDGAGWTAMGASGFFTSGTRRLGQGARKSLLGGHLPLVVARFEDEGIAYEETLFAHSEGMSPAAELCAYLRLRSTAPVELGFGLEPALAGAPGIRRTGSELCVRLAYGQGGAGPEEVEPHVFESRLGEARAAWQEILSSGMDMSLPEPRVNDAWRAWLAPNFIDVDRKGTILEPHDGSGFYEAVFDYSAALYCHALDLYGFHEDAGRYLDSLLAFVQPDGLFHVNYGLPGMGALLFALSEHHRLTQDTAALCRAAPKMLAMCRWLLRRRAESMIGPPAERGATYGLIRYTPYADYPEPTCNYYGDAYSCAGIEAAAAALREIGMAEEADWLAREAAAYRADILASMDRAVIEQDGLHVLPMEPETRRLLKAAGGSAGGYYGLVASMLLESGFLPAGDPRAAWITGFMERRNGLILGMCEFAGGVDHAYTFGYWLDCLRRDEPRRAILGLYGSLAYGMGRDTFCGVEVTRIRTGENTPTTPHLYSGTQQLRLLRMMLLREEGDDLLLAPAVPRDWLEPGKTVEVRRAPTRFGRVSFSIACAQDSVTLRLDPALRARATVIRLRRPHPRPIAAVAAPGVRFTVRDDAVELRDLAGPVEIEVRY